MPTVIWLMDRAYLYTLLLLMLIVTATAASLPPSNVPDSMESTDVGPAATVDVLPPFPQDHNYAFECIGTDLTGPLTYSWDFGDNTSITGKSVPDIFHSYRPTPSGSVFRDYTVTCTATNGTASAIGQRAIRLYTPDSTATYPVTVRTVSSRGLDYGFWCNSIGFSAGASAWRINGTTDTGAPYSYTNAFVGGTWFQHEFPARGNYTVSCRAFMLDDRLHYKYYDENDALYHDLHHCERYRSGCGANDSNMEDAFTLYLQSPGQPRDTTLNLQYLEPGDVRLTCARPATSPNHNTYAWEVQDAPLGYVRSPSVKEQQYSVSIFPSAQSSLIRHFPPGNYSATCQVYTIEPNSSCNSPRGCNISSTTLKFEITPYEDTRHVGDPCVTTPVPQTQPWMCTGTGDTCYLVGRGSYAAVPGSFTDDPTIGYWYDGGGYRQRYCRGGYWARQS